MGAYSPAPVMTPEMTRRTMDEIIRPTVRGMAQRGTPFKGVLFAGLMITADGPKLIEYNVRFGDPETQVLMMRLQVGPAAGAARHRRRRARDLRPALARRGGADRRDGRQRLSRRLRQGHARSAASTPRARSRASRSSTPARAREGDQPARHRRPRAQRHRARQDRRRGAARAYAAIAKIDWPGGFCRRDIGWRAHRPREGRRMSALPDLFPGFAERRIETGGRRDLRCAPAARARRCCCCTAIRRRTSCWHKIAPELARHFTLVIPDLRGYGASSAPRRRCRAHDLLQARDGRGLPRRHARARARALHGCRPRPRRARRLSPGARPSRGRARADPARHHADRRGVAAHERRTARSSPTTGRSWRSRTPCPRR